MPEAMARGMLPVILVPGSTSPVTAKVGPAAPAPGQPSSPDRSSLR